MVDCEKEGGQRGKRKGRRGAHHGGLSNYRHDGNGTRGTFPRLLLRALRVRLGSRFILPSFRFARFEGDALNDATPAAYGSPPAKGGTRLAHGSAWSTAATRARDPGVPRLNLTVGSLFSFRRDNAGPSEKIGYTATAGRIRLGCVSRLFSFPRFLLLFRLRRLQGPFMPTFSSSIPSSSAKINEH